MRFRPEVTLLPKGTINLVEFDIKNNRRRVSYSVCPRYVLPYGKENEKIENVGNHRTDHYKSHELSTLNLLIAIKRYRQRSQEVLR